MTKFKVGDIIIGNKKNVGSFTGMGSICRVTRLFEFSVEGSDIEVYVIKGNYPGEKITTSSLLFNLPKSNFRRMT